MRNARNLKVFVWTAILFAAIFLAACGGKVDLQKQMTGVWEDRLGHETVELQLGGNSKTVKVAGTSYPATIDAVDNDKGQIRLKVQNGSGKDELWTLTQMWEDSDRFNIVFERGEQKEVLIPKKRS
jgi:hypothetical protein